MVAVLNCDKKPVEMRDSENRKVINLCDERNRISVSPTRKQIRHRYGIPGEKKGSLSKYISPRALQRWVEDAAIPSHRCPSTGGVFEPDTVAMLDDYFLARWYLSLNVSDYWHKVVCINPRTGEALPSLQKRFLEAFEVPGNFLTPLEKYCLLERHHSLPFLVQLSGRWDSFPEESEAHPVIVDKFASYKQRMFDFKAEFEEIDRKLEKYKIASFQFYK